MAEKTTRFVTLEAKRPLDCVAVVSGAWVVSPEAECDRPEPAPVVERTATPADPHRALYEAHARAIHRFLRDLLGNAADAADATQETFVRAFRQAHTVRQPERVVSWLFGIARNVYLEQVKARRRDTRDRRQCAQTAVHVDQLTPEATLLGREAAEVVQQALSALSENRRAALLLRVDHGLPYSAIANVMGWTVAKTKVEVHRARRHLRACLAERLDGGAP